MLSREDKMALVKEAGIVDIGPGEGLKIKAAVSITWSKMRVLRSPGLFKHWKNKIGNDLIN